MGAPDVHFDEATVSARARRSEIAPVKPDKLGAETGVAWTPAGDTNTIEDAATQMTHDLIRIE
jgi:hypothetical protein